MKRAATLLLLLFGAAGCSKTNEALVLFGVDVGTKVGTFTSIEFSVTSRSDVPKRAIENVNNSLRPTSTFGYYMPGVNGDVTIQAQALDDAGCTVGQGTLSVSGVMAGQAVTSPTNLSIAPATGCPADAGKPGAGGAGGTTGAAGGAGITGSGGGGGTAGAAGNPGTGGAGGTTGAGGGAGVTGSGGGGGTAGAAGKPGTGGAGGIVGTGGSPGTGGGAGTTGTGGNPATGGSPGTGGSTGGATGSGGAAGGPPPKLALGAPCTAGSACGSSICADGVCCDGACTGICEACNAAGNCVPVTGAPHAGHGACTGAGATCGGTCGGTLTGVCTYPGSESTCRQASCTSGTATLAAGCDGTGACPAAQTVSCAPNSCSGTACAGGCSSAAPCVSGDYCAGGVCKPTQANGTACSTSDQCTSGACVDSTCCGSASCNAGYTCASGSCVVMAGCGSTPALGCPCTSSGTTACNGAHQKLQLICMSIPGQSGLAWETLGTCSSGQNCDNSVGACANIVTGCAGQSPNFAFCDSGGIDKLDVCGPDLTTVSQSTCMGVCSAGVCQSPRCGDTKVETGEECDDGNTVPLDGCESTCIKSAVQKVAIGDGNSCALCRGGIVRCWGQNSDGQLGLGHTNFVADRAPYLITDASGNPGVVNLGGTAATDIAVGSGFACALLSGGSVRCWGKNDAGQLGLGNTTAMPTTVGGAVSLGSGLTATALTAGDNYACAVLSNGSVRCWGDNSIGELGTGDSVAHLIANVSLGTTASSVAAGFENVCALLTSGAVRCWGDNYFGEFGLGSTTISDSTTAAPSTYANVSLKSGRTATALTSGTTFNCARLDDGEAECWGIDNVGQLGIGSTQTIGDNEVPGNAGVVALGAVSVSAIAAGYDHTCALIASGGGLKCWGNNLKGQLGQGDTARRGDVGATSPSQIAAIKFPSGLSPSAVTTGDSYTCALLSDGSVRCWGWNDRGQLGLGSVSTPPADFIGGASTETPDKLPAVQIIAPH